MVKRYAVGGFSFSDEKEAEQAKKELEGIKYIKSKVDSGKPEMMLEIYNKIIAEHLFETAVGICYLKELQEKLMMNPETRGKVIKAIPVEGSHVKPREIEKVTQVKGGKTEKQIKLKEKHINYKNRYRTLLSVSIVLLVIVAFMFAITITSNSPNILNYENEIINKYEDWEKQLQEREDALDKMENQ